MFLFFQIRNAKGCQSHNGVVVIGDTNYKCTFNYNFENNFSKKNLEKNEKLHVLLLVSSAEIKRKDEKISKNEQKKLFPVKNWRKIQRIIE